MLTASYHKRLQADLARWVEDGLVSAESAATIRRGIADRGVKLPALLGLFGGLLIAASIAAFVAANWEEIPRLVKLAMILAALAISLGWSARLQRQGSARGADTAATCGVLIFGAGIALIGQMYHLPADWPAGALMVSLGGLLVAFLLRSDGALIIAFVALGAWASGRWDWGQGGILWEFLPFYLPMLWLALVSRNRLVHHLAVVGLGLWLAHLPGYGWFGRFDFGILAYFLALSAIFVALGALALDRGTLRLPQTCLPWGLLAFIVTLNLELGRILERELSAAGTAALPIYVAYAVAVALIVALALLARERRFAWPSAVSLVLALLIPAVFWTGIATGLFGKIVVATLVLFSAIALVLAGSGGGVRKMTVAGSALFGLSVLVLLWQTVGTLIDQSLFFLVAGAVLLALASGTRRMLARFAKPAEAQP